MKTDTTEGTFKAWCEEPENKELIKKYNIPLFIANQIWDAAKVAAVNDYLGLLHDGILMVNPNRT